MTSNQINIESLIPGYLKNSTHFSVVVTDIEGKYSYVNPLFLERFSFISHDFVGKPFEISIHPEDIESCNNAAYLLISGQKESVTVQVRKPFMENGEYFWTQWEFSLLTHQNKPLGIICVGVDITKEKWIAKVNLEYSKSIESLTDTITDIFYEIDENWEYKAINNEACKVLNVEKQDILGKNLWEFSGDIPNSYRFPYFFKKTMYEKVKTEFDDFYHTDSNWYRTTVYPSSKGILVFSRNVTQEKEAEQKIKDSQLKLKALFNSVSDSNIFIAPDYTILAFNYVAEYETRQFQGNIIEKGASFKPLIIPEFYDEFTKAFQKTLLGLEIFIEKKLKIRNVDFIYHFFLKPVYSENNELMGISLISRNVTERKKLEANEKEKDALFRAIYNSILDPLVITDLTGNILFVNRIAESLSAEEGFDIPEIKKAIKDIFPKKYDVEIEKTLNDLAKGKNHTFYLNTKNNHFKVAGFPVYNENQQIYALAFAGRDLTREKLVERELQDSENRFKTIIEEAPNAVIIINEELEILLVNKEFEKLSQYERKEVLNKSIDLLIPSQSKDQYKQALKKVSSKNELICFGKEENIYASTKLGENIPIIATVNTISVKGFKNLIIILENLTELKQINDKLKLQNDQLKDIAWTQSHLVRTPVANILGLSNIILDPVFQHSTQTILEYLRIITSETEKLDGLIKEIVQKTKKIE
ncbi:MAG: PAS domain S-box protein [Luteibaculaceae bacterium]